MFANSGVSIGDMCALNVAVGDIDHDGDNDAVFANLGDSNGGMPNQVWLNDGTGSFTDSGQALGNGRSSDVVLADVNADGHLDVLVANYGTSGEGNRVYLNDSTGVFSDTGQSLGADITSRIAVADVDGDGDVMAMRWQLACPTAQQLERLQFALQDAPLRFSSSDIGFKHARDQMMIGTPAQFDNAVNRLLSLQHLRVPGMAVLPGATTVDAVVVYGVRVGPLWGLAAYRVLELSRSHQQASVTYGTLAMHGVVGRERFDVRVVGNELVFTIEKWFSVPFPVWMLPETVLSRFQQRFVSSVTTGMREALHLF